MRRLLSVLLTICLLVSVTACGSPESSDLMGDVQPRDVEEITELAVGSAAAADFAVRLLQESAEAGENTLLSPLSVYCALAMTANGARGETLSQLEAGLGLSIEELNGFLHSYMDNLPQGEKYKLHIANSIWFRDQERLTVEQDFLQTNADYYGAEIYSAPFDQTTLREINGWVKKNTDGMIPEILNEINEDAVMYLINALGFDAQWQSVYWDSQVWDGTFTKEGGTETDAEFMHCSEYRYLEDDLATGFIKHYANASYAFVALLPNEGVPVREYVDSLTGEHLQALLQNVQNTMVQTSIPKFETEYSTELSAVLKAMGMTAAFDGDRADFTALGTSTAGNIFISRVLHKTYISVGEQGTKAGAATAVEMSDGAAMEPEEIKEVYLTRPFVYLIIDCENNVPLFIGTMMDIAK